MKSRRQTSRFSYDPGFQCAMVTKHIYDRLDQKPAFCPINKSRVGVAQGVEVKYRTRIFFNL